MFPSNLISFHSKLQEYLQDMAKYSASNNVKQIMSGSQRLPDIQRSRKTRNIMNNKSEKTKTLKRADRELKQLL